MINLIDLSKAGAFFTAIFFIAVSGQTTQMPGTWKNVTPAGLDLSGAPMGASTVCHDVARPSDVYMFVQYNGVWRSTDYGVSWLKASTGANINRLQEGCPWYSAIDANPSRDPSTPPALYATSGYGAMGVWKSTDGGVNWFDVWTTNIYAPDGVTNISADVSRDIAALLMASSTNPNRLILSMHSYSGTGGNNGIFETVDGGGKWIVHKAQQFQFQPHSDDLGLFDSVTWVVSKGIGSAGTDVFRTTNAGASWQNATGQLAKSLGARMARAGNVWYSSTKSADALYKTSDKGVTWVKTSCPGFRVTWVAATATKVYCGAGYDFDPQPEIYSAALSNDSVWQMEKVSTMSGSGEDACVTFDGVHYIIIGAFHKAGFWRYVEPASATSALPAQSAMQRTMTRFMAPRIQTGTTGCRIAGKTGTFFDVKGRIAAKTK